MGLSAFSRSASRVLPVRGSLKTTTGCSVRASARTASSASSSSASRCSPPRMMLPAQARTRRADDYTCR
eukprot:scaffold1054_cov366-Prasinococcus_capsulatus_cf.AAC.9